MIKRIWIRWFASSIIGIILLVLALLIYVYSFACPWPNMDDLIGEPDLYRRSVDIGLGDQAISQLVITAARRILQEGVAQVRFNSDRDFIEFASPKTSQWWQYRNGEFAIANRSDVDEATSQKTDMSEFLRGEYSRTFRYVLFDGGSTRACAIAQVDERGGMNFYEFWFLFRLGPGIGPWWLISRGSIMFGYLEGINISNGSSMSMQHMTEVLPYFLSKQPNMMC